MFLREKLSGFNSVKPDLFQKRKSIVFVWLCDHYQPHTFSSPAERWKAFGLGQEFQEMQKQEIVENGPSKPTRKQTRMAKNYL
jgi:hypothetical protein